MKALSDILRALHRQLSGSFPARPGVRQLSLPLGSISAADMLAWLASQSVYPQFFWQHRDGGEQVAACGSCRTFQHADEACAFLSQTGQAALRIWGLNAFGQAELGAGAQSAFLFLPRIEWVHRGKQQWININLFSETSLREDAQRAADYVSELQPLRPLARLNAQTLRVQHQPEQTGWTTLVERALRAIEDEVMEKVVLARRSCLTLASPLQPAALMDASRRVNHYCYHFMLAFSPRQAFLGSSPERLYRRQRHQLETEALAGTVASAEARQETYELGQWLMKDAKNQHENLLVVDDICQRLQGGATAVDVMPPEIIRLRKVQHLRRRIHARLERADDGDCLQRLQPTAAVAGLPREPARRFINANEPFCRGWYAGSAGYLSLNHSEFTVALRSAQIAATEVCLYAGAGIVAGSDPQQEWQEIENKAAGLRTLLESDGGLLLDRPVVDRD